MKIVSLIPQNIGNSKMPNAFSQLFTGFADDVSGLAMGSDRWISVPNLSNNPADVFATIELKKTGGTAQGSAVNGTCISTDETDLAYQYSCTLITALDENRL